MTCRLVVYRVSRRLLLSFRWLNSRVFLITKCMRVTLTGHSNILHALDICVFNVAGGVCLISGRFDMSAADLGCGVSCRV